ncbi:hypothetical protein TRFO_06897 [Tritrichomonas foetus]|uniref:Uncharacterized protein n=1 Tax=Tritrichomonas foetus TaxID=1144522 RepID=A0A1J4JZA5_9EUKA|nr:hypothetical protein TRFO_06897 [Tritrichomonas foetus]|eukprot:OHT02860.1 hypothetical protein TRFO_06897 [Tritrichomonas foetus]
MSDSNLNKRNYIRRKKYLNDCISRIQATLEFVHLAKGEKMDPADSQKQAMANAQAIEAACWSPYTKLSADSYQKLMMTKTQELCRTIIKKSLLSVDLSQLQKLTAALLNERSHTPQPTLPVPMIPQSDKKDIQSREEGEYILPDCFDKIEFCPFVPSFEKTSEDLSESPFLAFDDNDKLLETTIMRIDRSFECVDFPFSVC